MYQSIYRMSCVLVRARMFSSSTAHPAFQTEIYPHPPFVAAITATIEVLILAKAENRLEVGKYVAHLFIWLLTNYVFPRAPCTFIKEPRHGQQPRAQQLAISFEELAMSPISREIDQVLYVKDAGQMGISVRRMC